MLTEFPRVKQHIIRNDPTFDVTYAYVGVRIRGQFLKNEISEPSAKAFTVNNKIILPTRMRSASY